MSMGIEFAYITFCVSCISTTYHLHVREYRNMTTCFSWYMAVVYMSIDEFAAVSTSHQLVVEAFKHTASIIRNEYNITLQKWMRM